MSSIFDEMMEDRQKLIAQAVVRYKDKKICNLLLEEAKEQQEEWQDRHAKRFKDIIEENNAPTDNEQQ